MPTLAELLDQAVRHHQGGQLGPAENLYRQILQVDPRQADAWHFLGLLAGQVGRPELAVEYIGRALRIAPDFAEAHYNLGNVLRNQGKLDKADGCYRAALRLNPNIAEAHNNLGIVLRSQGKLDEAAACYRTALGLKPGYAEAHNNLGNVLREQGKSAEAKACFQDALRLNERYAAAHNNLAIVLEEQGYIEEAEVHCREALRHSPAYAEAHNNLGSSLRDQGKLEEAEASCRAALRLKPDFAQAHNNLGNILGDRGRLEEAEASYRQALRLEPDHVEAHYNLGNALRDQGHLEEAMASYREALRLKPDYACAHYNLSLLLLLQGDLSAGWPGYECRPQIIKNPGNILLPRSWDGHALDGQTILLQAEQGLGDTFQFVRYAPMVKAKVGRVILQCPPALTEILAGCSGIDQLVPHGTPLPVYNVNTPLLSLPLLFGTTLATIPGSGPYLAVDPARVDRWRACLADVPGFKVGICWQGNPQFKDDRLRSVPMAYFAPLAAVRGVSLVALQRGQALEQIAEQGNSMRVVDLPGRSNDPAEGWLDTAALIQALDLVISTDTGVVHLAGALGAPVWVALHFMSDWRWLLDRKNSPWYPTMRLFRQRKPGDWSDVFQRIAGQLQVVTS